MIIDNNTKLNCEYYPTVLFNLPLSCIEVEVILQRLMIMERKYNKQRGDWFQTSVDKIASMCRMCEKTIRGHIKELKAKRFIEQENCGRASMYRINWLRIGDFLTVDDYRDN